MRRPGRSGTGGMPPGLGPSVDVYLLKNRSMASERRSNVIGFTR